MKKRWNLSYKKGLRNPLVSKNAVCRNHQLIFSVQYGGYNYVSDVINLNLDTQEVSLLLTEDNSIRTLGVHEENRIYFSTFSGFAYCMDFKGNVIWKTDIGDKSASFEVVIDEDRIYFYDYALYCLNKQNGEVIWMNLCENKNANCTFAMSDHFIYHGEYNGKIRCFDKMTGEQIWDYGYDLYTEHCELMGDKLLTFQSDGTVIILDSKNGKKIAKRKIFDGDLTTIPKFIGNKLYLGYRDDVVGDIHGEMVCYCFDEKFEFIKEFGYPVETEITSNIFVEGDKIIFATENEKMYVIENQNESQIIKTKGACRYIFSHEDSILVISDKGQVECYQ